MLTSLAWLGLAALLSASPIETTYKAEGPEFVIQISADGTSRSMALSTVQPRSFWSKAKEDDHEVHLMLEGEPFGLCKLPSIGSPESSFDGVLAPDFLANFAIGIDLLSDKITFWPKGDLPLADVTKWMEKAPSWEEGKPVPVERIPLTHLSSGAWTVPVVSQGITLQALLRLGSYSTCFSKACEPAPHGAVYFDGTDVWHVANIATTTNGVASWTSYSPNHDAFWQLHPEAAQSTVSLLAFHSRRVIFDPVAGALYVEKLPHDGKLTMWLNGAMEIPLKVEGQKIKLARTPGQIGYKQFEDVLGSEVLAIAGISSRDLLSYLRTNNQESADHLATLQSQKALGFKVMLKLANGHDFLMDIAAASKETPHQN